MNIKLYTSKLINSSLYSFCKHENETTLHVFYACNSTRTLWSQLKLFLKPNLILPYLLPQSTIFGLIVLLNHLLLLFKLNVCKSRIDKVSCFNKLLWDITKVNKRKKDKHVWKYFPDSSSCRSGIMRGLFFKQVNNNNYFNRFSLKNW